VYVVAAAEEHPGIPRAVASRPKWIVATAEPVGIQHAAAQTVGAGPPSRALCGADLADWIVFPDRRFDPGCAAACQRCAQLVTAAIQPSTTDAWTVGRSDHILPSGLGRDIRARSVGRVVVLDATGRLSDLVDDLDHATRFALAEEPRGVVCDVSRVDDVNAPGALRGLALNGRHPRDWPAVPLAVAGLDPRAGQSLRSKPLGDHLVVTTSLRQALSMVMQAGLPDARSLRLSPHPTAPRAARDFVSRALLDWRLSQHLPAASLVVSELVTNAMIHAGTAIELTVTEHRQAIRVAVRDHSPDLPVHRPDTGDVNGRGMTIVAGLSHAWGVLPDADGSKVVWAVIDTAPPTAQTERRDRRPAAAVRQRRARPNRP
jgi:anti-sigma regulatory factor (Ser/Thr protein kinase)